MSLTRHRGQRPAPRCPCAVGRQAGLDELDPRVGVPALRTANLDPVGKRPHRLILACGDPRVRTRPGTCLDVRAALMPLRSLLSYAQREPAVGALAQAVAREPQRAF